MSALALFIELHPGDRAFRAGAVTLNLNCSLLESEKKKRLRSHLFDFHPRYYRLAVFEAAFSNL